MALLDDLSFKDVLATSATVSTVLQFLTGSVVCYRYIRKKSTGDTSALPFISGFLSCFLWLKYGMLTAEHTVISVNVVGTILFLSYVLIYFTYSVSKRIVARQFVAACSFIMLCTVYTSSEGPTEKSIKVVGMICCCVGVLFFASPLTKLAHVVRTKSTESLPFPIILASFIVSLQWFVYGQLIDDRFIQIPNLLGCLLTAMQLLLYAIYPSRNEFSSNGIPAYKPLRMEPEAL